MKEGRTFLYCIEPCACNTICYVCLSAPVLTEGVHSFPQSSRENSDIVPKFGQE
jgi:hypothetical protein